MAANETGYTKDNGLYPDVSDCNLAADVAFQCGRVQLRTVVVQNGSEMRIKFTVLLWYRNTVLCS